MSQEIRQVVYDTVLNVEAYGFHGIMQKFPNHFHDYYVIGFIEKGERKVTCGGTEALAEAGDLILFNPEQCHACEQADGGSLDYRCINIQPDIMRRAAYEITGRNDLPRFNRQIIRGSELVPQLAELHRLIMEQGSELQREERFYFLLSRLIEEYANNTHYEYEPQSDESLAVRLYIEEHYAENISLNGLAKLTGFSKYHLLRIFTKENGITPYSYLSTVRIDKAKKLLKDGVTPLETALSTGFSDQSHFTNFFKRLIGLTPKQYMNIFKDK